MQVPSDSGPAMPIAIPLSDLSDVPVAPVAVSFVSDPPSRPPSPHPGRVKPERALPSRRALGWAADLALLSLVFAGHFLVAALLAGERRSVPGLLLAAPWLWAALAGALAVAWSWVFVALGGRTPGMALTGQRLRSLQGGALTPFAAFVRAVLSVASGAPALFGFALALFDPRAQTLHDKICRCIAVVD